MADYKEGYSEASSSYISNDVQNSALDKARYDRSKAREAKFNDNWKKQMVNINDIVNEFAPNSVGERKGVKFEFKGDKYTIKADMPSGYLRIMDNATGGFVKLDGTISSVNSETHFKIKKREEM